MAQYRNPRGSGRDRSYERGQGGGYSGGPDRYRRGGSRYQTSPDRDRYQTGGERRYSSDWDEESSRQESYQGDRSYSAGGYPEEFGYRSDYGQERQGGSEYGQGHHGEPYGGRSRFGSERWSDERGHEDRQSSGGDYSQGSQYQHGGFRGQRSQGYGDTDSDWDVARDWSGEQQRTLDYYGTGRHYGGGYGTAPSTRASGSGWSNQEIGWGDRGGIGRQSSSGQYGSQSRHGEQHEQGLGPFRGRGPRGYARSDERLKEMICERLTDDPAIDASEISVEVSQQVVKLTGSVDDRRTKYEVEELVERLGGVKDIDNQLRVQSSMWRSSSEQQHGASENRAASGAGTSATSSSTTSTRRG